MGTMTQHINRKVQILVFLLSSLFITGLVFIADTDSGQGGALDSILSLVLFVGFFTCAQIGISKLIGKKLVGWIKVVTSILAGILGSLGFYVLLFSILYRVKF